MTVGEAKLVTVTVTVSNTNLNPSQFRAMAPVEVKKAFSLGGLGLGIRERGCFFLDNHRVIYTISVGLSIANFDIGGLGCPWGYSFHFVDAPDAGAALHSPWD